MLRELHTHTHVVGRVVSERGPAWPDSHPRRELYHIHIDRLWVPRI